MALVLTAIYFLAIQRHGRRPVPGGRYPGGRGEYPHDTRRPERARGNERGENPVNGSETSAAGQVVCETQYLANWLQPAAESCTVRMRNGYPLPDPRCTPGGVNPSLTADVLRDRAWRTRTVRNCASSEAQKHVAYRWYDIEKPRINSNQNQVCELDHLVPLELGGADGLGNIWPECGPDAVTLNERYFKQKDHVENYLGEEVKAGRVPLDAAQRGIASDWTQYIPDAEHWCGSRGRC